MQELKDKSMPILEEHFQAGLKAYLDEKELQDTEDPVEALIFIAG